MRLPVDHRRRPDSDPLAETDPWRHLLSPAIPKIMEACALEPLTLPSAGSVLPGSFRPQAPTTGHSHRQGHRRQAPPAEAARAPPDPVPVPGHRAAGAAAGHPAADIWRDQVRAAVSPAGPPAYGRHPRPSHPAGAAGRGLDYRLDRPALLIGIHARRQQTGQDEPPLVLVLVAIHATPDPDGTWHATMYSDSQHRWLPIAATTVAAKLSRRGSSRTSWPGSAGPVSGPCADRWRAGLIRARLSSTPSSEVGCRRAASLPIIQVGDEYFK